MSSEFKHKRQPVWKMLKPSVNLGFSNLTCIAKEEKIFIGVLRDAPQRGLVKKTLRKGSQNCNRLAKKAEGECDNGVKVYTTLSHREFPHLVVASKHRAT